MEVLSKTFPAKVSQMDHSAGTATEASHAAVTTRPMPAPAGLGRATAGPPGGSGDDGTGAAAARTKADPGARPRIALVGPADERMVQLRTALGNGYRFVEYASAEQAWATLQFSHDLSAIVCRQSLGGLSGLALIQRLRQQKQPGLQRLPACLVADSIDEDLRAKARKAQVNFLAAFDRSLGDLDAWLADRLLGAGPSQGSRDRGDALRRWAFGHLKLDDKVRQATCVMRIESEGLGSLVERLEKAGVERALMLAESFNAVWLCAARPVSSMPRHAFRAALGCLGDPAPERAWVSISYAPMLQLAHETYEKLQTLATAPPAPGRIQVTTHHWQAQLPAEVARALLR